MKSTKSRIKYTTYAALIAAIYTALTLISSMMGLSSGVLQLRLSETLTLLPLLTPAAVPGLTVGCLISNLITGCIPADVILGTAATFAGAAGTRLLRHRSPLLAALPPILANTVAVPLVLKYGYGISGGLLYFTASVFVGELVSCGVFGLLLLHSVKNKRIFKDI